MSPEYFYHVYKTDTLRTFEGRVLRKIPKVGNVE